MLKRTICNKRQAEGEQGDQAIDADACQQHGFGGKSCCKPAVKQGEGKGDDLDKEQNRNQHSHVKTKITSIGGGHADNRADPVYVKEIGNQKDKDLSMLPDISKCCQESAET